MGFLRLISRVILLGLLLSACVKQSTTVTPIASNEPVSTSTLLLPTSTKSAPSAIIVRIPPAPIDPTPTPTVKPTATIIPPASLDEMVVSIVDSLNAHRYDGYPLSEQFFYGIFGIHTTTDTTRFFSPTHLLSHYAGDQYGVRELAIGANPASPLPATLTMQQAMALNPTEKAVQAIVSSTGWGIDQQGEALLYFAQQAGEYEWIGAIFSFDGFATAKEYPLVEQPAELRAYLTEKATLAALKAQLSEQFRTDIGQISINPAHSTAVIAESSHQFGIYQYAVIDIASGSRTSFQSELGRAIFVTEHWLDDQQLVVKYHTRDTDYPVPGQLAILDVATGELTLLDEKVFVHETLSVTPNGAIVYPKGENVSVWQDGVVQLIDMQPILDIDDGKDRLITSVAMSADQRYIIALTRIDDAVGYVLLDIKTSKTAIINTFTPPAIDGVPPPAIWNPSGSWAVLSFSAWTAYAEQSGLILVEAATGKTRHLSINSKGGYWINDELLLFNAMINDEQQAFLYAVASGEQIRVQIDEEVVREERISAEILTQDVIFPALNMRLKIPEDWQAHIYGNDAYLYSNTHPLANSDEYHYTVAVEKIPNLTDLPLAQAYANKYSPDLVNEIADALTIQKTGYQTLIRSDFIFSADGALGYFYKSHSNYRLLALSPYDVDEPFQAQANIAATFEAMAASVDRQFLSGADSAELCSPLAANSDSAISATFQPHPCVVWHDDDAAEGYRVTLTYVFDYETGAIEYEYVHYLVAGDVREVTIQPEDSPCYTQFGELIRNGSVMIDIVALTTSGERVVDGMGINTHCSPTEQP